MLKVKTHTPALSGTPDLPPACISSMLWTIDAIAIVSHRVPFIKTSEGVF